MKKEIFKDEYEVTKEMNDYFIKNPICSYDIYRKKNRKLLYIIALVFSILLIIDFCVNSKNVILLSIIIVLIIGYIIFLYKRVKQIRSRNFELYLKRMGVKTKSFKRTISFYDEKMVLKENNTEISYFYKDFKEVVNNDTYIFLIRDIYFALILTKEGFKDNSLEKFEKFINKKIGENDGKGI